METKRGRHSIDHEWQPRPEWMIPIYSLDEILQFQDECEEHEFWATHEVSNDLADQAEPLPDDLVALLEQIRERRARARAGHTTAPSRQQPAS